MTSNQDVINYIRTIPSLERLDHFSRSFFRRHYPVDNQEVIDAIARREEELEEMGQDHYDIDVEVEIPEVTSIDLVRRKTAPKKEEKRIYQHAHHVECGCKDKYGVLCLHKLHLDEVGPDDYEECAECGFSHRYDPRLALEFHSRIE